MMDNFFKKMNFRKLSRERRKEAVTKLSRELHLNGITAVPVQRWPNVVLAHDDSKPTPEELIINRLGFIILVCISISTSISDGSGGGGGGGGAAAAAAAAAYAFAGANAGLLLVLMVVLAAAKAAVEGDGDGGGPCLHLFVVRLLLLHSQLRSIVKQ